MAYLLVVSLLWAFSFGLIKGNLTGLDASFVSFARLAISLVVFLPFLRLGGLSRRLLVALPLVGAVQYGLMYALYLASYQDLQAHQVALFTVTTPLFVVVTEGLLARRLRPLPLVAAAIAVVGAAVLALRDGSHDGVWRGFMLLQASNLCFAVGQVLYRRLMKGHGAKQQVSHFALLFGGGALVTLVAATLAGGFPAPETLTSTHVWTLLYLGLLPSGVGFFLWNVGATRTTAGVLAVMNNAKVPLGVVVSLAVFGESADLPRLVTSLLLVAAALVLAKRSERS